MLKHWSKRRARKEEIRKVAILAAQIASEAQREDRWRRIQEDALAHFKSDCAFIEETRTQWKASPPLEPTIRPTRHLRIVKN
jgi:hypothetical protein